jgi:tetratricopeptide (TPR) repeat protein
MRHFTNYLKLIVLMIMLWASAPCAFADEDDKTARVIDLNNSGVKLLNCEHYDLAIEAFQQALVLDPNYGIAHDNLVIALNWKGSKIRNNPVEALRQFHKALLLSPNSPMTMQNLETILPKLGLRPNDYRDRFGLAAMEMREGDYASAFVEYWEAMRLQDLQQPQEETTQDLATQATSQPDRMVDHNFDSKSGRGGHERRHTSP